MNSLDFPTTEDYTKEDIRKVQSILLTMAKNVHQILTANEIPYMISMGTLLGAVRHQGFIPWDDDFDIFLFEDSYEKAVNVLEKDLPEWMVVHNEKNDPIYWPYWSRIRDINSYAVSQKNLDDKHYKYQGINLDLYKLKKTKSELVETAILKENLQFYQRKKTVGLIDETTWKSKEKELRKLIKEKETFINDNLGNDVYYFVILMKRLLVEDIFPLKLIDFEDTQFYAPNNSDTLLRQAYGDYMNLPAYENRLPHYTKVYYSNDKPN